MIMCENDTIFGLVLRFVCIWSTLVFSFCPASRHVFAKKISFHFLIWFDIWNLYLLIYPASCCSLLPFSFQTFWSLHISFHTFARGPQDQRARALHDHRTRGTENQEQRSLNFFSRCCFFFLRGTWNMFFGGNVIFFQYHPPTSSF